MKNSHLRQRIPSAKIVGKGQLFNWRFIFNKKSKDGSSKANLKSCPESTVWGILYEINRSDLEELDNIESGYKRVTMQIHASDGKIVNAEVYISSNTENNLPFDWYKDIIVRGAQENLLPKFYIEFLQGHVAKKNNSL